MQLWKYLVLLNAFTFARRNARLVKFLDHYKVPRSSPTSAGSTFTEFSARAKFQIQFREHICKTNRITCESCEVLYTTDADGNEIVESNCPNDRDQTLFSLCCDFHQSF